MAAEEDDGGEAAAERAALRAALERARREQEALREGEEQARREVWAGSQNLYDTLYLCCCTPPLPLLRPHQVGRLSELAASLQLQLSGGAADVPPLGAEALLTQRPTCSLGGPV